MAPKRENPESIELARVSREVREQDDRPRVLDPKGWVLPAGLVAAIVGGVWGVAIGFSNFNHRIAQEEARLDQQRQDINRLKRQVVYTSEWRAWHNVAQLKNAGKVDLPDPKDFTIDRTE